MDSLVPVGGYFTVEDLDGLVCFPQVDLAVVAQVAVVVEGGDPPTVVTDGRSLEGQPGEGTGNDFRPLEGVDVVGVWVAVTRQVGAVDRGDQHHHVPQGRPSRPIPSSIQ